MADKKMATLAGEQSVKALAERLVNDGTVAKPADPVAFEKQLLAVNPHLADIAKLPAGTPVVIPKAPVLPTTPAESNPLVHQAMDNVRALLADGHSMLARAAAAEKATLAEMSSPATLKVIADLRVSNAALAQSLTSLSEASKGVLTKIDTASAARTNAVRAVITRLGGKLDDGTPS